MNPSKAMTIHPPRIVEPCSLLQALGDISCSHLSDDFQTIKLSGGDFLFHQGDPGDALYVVLHGRLAAMTEGPVGARSLVGEIGRGECVGEMAILTNEVRSASVMALRDTRLIRLSKSAFRQLAQRCPDVLMGISQLIAQRLGQQLHNSPRDETGSKTIAVMPAHEGIELTAFVRGFVGQLSNWGETWHARSAMLADVPDTDAWRMVGEPLSDAVICWLNERAESCQFVVYEADVQITPWTQYAVRQADHLLVIAESEGDDLSPQTTSFLRQRRQDQPTMQQDLVLVHPVGSREPSETSRWLRALSVHAHHHVRRHRHDDIARLARMVAGRAIGIVLGGGGARGFAHIGVLRALKEANIPLDYIGGTSMGAMIAAQYAMGSDAEEMLALNRRWWLRSKLIRRVTFPSTSLLSRRSYYKLGQGMFGTRRIEDLWRPFFCLSSNMTRAVEAVHHSGALWKWVCASMAVPGLAPPIAHDGELFVDGGLLNNLPVSVMRQRCHGPIIAVDVSPETPLTAVSSPTPASSIRQHLSHVLPLTFGQPNVPNIFHILYRSTVLSSAQSTRQSRELADFCLRPPTASVGLLDMNAMQEIADTGYRYTQQQLQQSELSLLAASAPLRVA